MAFKASDLYFKDYKKTARADHYNPKIRVGKEHSSLNRTEEYEMVDFVNSTAKEFNWSENASTKDYQKIEKIVRLHVPTSIETRAGIIKWIRDNWKTYWDKL